MKFQLLFIALLNVLWIKICIEQKFEFQFVLVYMQILQHIKSCFKLTINYLDYRNVTNQSTINTCCYLMFMTSAFKKLSLKKKVYWVDENNEDLNRYFIENYKSTNLLHESCYTVDLLKINLDISYFYVHLK